MNEYVEDGFAIQEGLSYIIAYSNGYRRVIVDLLEIDNFRLGYISRNSGKDLLVEKMKTRIEERIENSDGTQKNIAAICEIRDIELPSFQWNLSPDAQKHLDSALSGGPLGIRWHHWYYTIRLSIDDMDSVIAGIHEKRLACTESSDTESDISDSDRCSHSQIDLNDPACCIIS